MKAARSLLPLICALMLASWGCAFQRGMLRITTDPLGADVSVDGRYVGVTPCEVPIVLDDGTRLNDRLITPKKIEVVKEGYKKVTQSYEWEYDIFHRGVHVSENNIVNLAFKLEEDRPEISRAAAGLKQTVLWRKPGRTRLLLVGISDYKDPGIPRVANGASDALNLAAFARSAGIPEDNITAITDTRASRSDITDALVKLKMATTEPTETAIFYFSGHGAPVFKEGEMADAVLVPYDAKESSLEFTGIKLSLLRQILSDVRGSWIVVLDACFSGREGRGLMARDVKALAVVPRGFSAAGEPPKNSWWITATSGDSFANDFPKANQALFTHFFLKALSGYTGVDANNDGLISLREAFAWTAKEVRAVSAKSLGRPQDPEILGAGDIVLTIPRQ